MIRPRRSLLFVPGSNARALEKARTLPADGIIIDLEDAVAPDAKEAARANAREAIAAKAFGKREVIVRINSLDSEWWIDDATMAARAHPDGILVPKVSGARDIEKITDRLSDASADHEIKLFAMIETARGLANVEAIAASVMESERRLAGLVLGTNDIAKETRARILPGRAPMLPWLSACVLAARAHGIDVIDAVYNDFKDGEGFARECVQGRDMGFDGKTLIHPAQIEACNTAFSPDDAEIARARKILAAFDLPENAGKGVIQMDGAMVELLHADMARRTVAMADMVAALKA